MNQSGVIKTVASNITQILFNTQNFISVSIVCGDTGITANADGKKVIPAGTPMKGSIQARGTAFTKGDDETAVGVLLHDVDVTYQGKGNGTLLLFGAVNLDRLDSTTKALFTADMIEHLDKIFFLKD